MNGRPLLRTDATESIANNFIVLRSMAGSRFGNTLYVEFETGDQMQTNIQFKNLSYVEYYDLDKDAWMMNNAIDAPSTPKASLAAELHKWYDCQGDACP